MNEEEQQLKTALGDEAQPHTKDVRAAIERAKENLSQEQAPIAEQTVQPDVQPDVQEIRREVPIEERVEMPSAMTEVQVPEPQQVAPQINRNIDSGMTVIPSDHPMAPLYIQQPMPPTMKSNRLAGVLISLLATVGFGVLYAGLISLMIAPQFPPSAFLQQGLYPYLTSLGFVFPVVAFFVGMMILVLIFNRAGWWVYAVLGVIVALLVWAAAGAGYALSPQLLDETLVAAESKRPFDISLIFSYALTLPAVLAALAGREVSVWFGAWIGKRGRKVKQLNAEASEEHRQKIAEVQAQFS